MIPQTYFPHLLRAIIVAIPFFVFLLSSSNLVAQSKEDCLACHSDETLTMEKHGKQISIAVKEAVLAKSTHKKLVCVACHTGFNPENIPHKEKIEPVNCLQCHKDAPPKHSFHPQMMQANGKNGPPNLSCKGCHGTHNVESPQNPGAKFSHEKIPSACGQCHQEIGNHFAQSEHGIAFANKMRGAPNCILCHKNPIARLSTGQDSTQWKIAQEKMCLSCHLDNPDVRNRMSPTSKFISAYEHSVHGAALLRGNAKAANCVDCHGSHQMNKGSDIKSTVNKLNIHKQCAKCHASIEKDYLGSVHGVAINNRNLNAPVCTDCHGEHNILKHTDPNSPVAAGNVSTQVCTPCHSSMKLSEKFGISSNRTQTFADSYHGLALRGGSAEVANCASCHGAHNIKPSWNPTSTIHKANLAKTCGKCHPGANQKFTIGSVHVTTEQKEEPILYWIATIYIILIVSTVGGMFFHNLIDLIKKAKRKILIRRGVLTHEYHGHALYVRMTRFERIQHFLLLTSFITLVVTGFMLRFPESWWVESIRSLSAGIFELRSLLHRISAVVMIAASVLHVYYIIFTQRGRELIHDLFPRLQDARDAVAVVKYNLGFSTVKPKLDRFSYVEKAEYWALVWGTIVMAATGFIMWFDNTFIGMLTKLGYDVARTVHYYEAWLATLAIIVWHFYFIMFNPDAYPMNLAWLTGKISEEEMAEEHALELERIKQREEDGEVIDIQKTLDEKP